ncbi:[FeFe] hydrogenase, group A [Papillibacter cinnamivorans]|uniref:NADH-quinone oxidoreductase subunit G n=1 Tax=Papillibacter cinnamivorans DSM 12816 TaxID=1122930 RepID=A0A1W2B9V3_9FIRM|nr:[FeFe] hydrogenase, group A [Papillibacter cinnamivorans]SMC69803.1 NADH-quinone oxidoreductase subunit G [Papillibacter cinnamivorans DSM 12816]
MNTGYVTIDGIPIAMEGEKNLLELIRKAGIDLPTFCYYSELSVYGACRMCMVETKEGAMVAACSTQPKEGMEILTNTPRLRRHRKMILELLLAKHCRDCTICEKNGRCRLQELANRFGITRLRFPGDTEARPDASSRCITLDTGKCILCGDCVRMCSEVQNLGILTFRNRGSRMTLGTRDGKPLAKSGCVGCGQCAAVCPTGAIVVKNDRERVWEAIGDPDTKVIAQIAPAVRVAVAEELRCAPTDNILGKLVASMHRLGFDEVFDTCTGADLTVLEESAELIARLEENRDLPLFTSCCPAWVSYLKQKHPELVSHLSSCRSPMEMFAAVIREQYKSSRKNIVHVAVMPCTAKKEEAALERLKIGGIQQVDYVITTQELIRMIRECGILFSEIEPEGLDMPFGAATGAGTIFGTAGGVTEAVLRRLSSDKSPAALRELAFRGVRGAAGLKETEVSCMGRTLRIAAVSGLKNAEDLLTRIQEGEHYDFVEVMACPGGCAGGAGQPFAAGDSRRQRSKELYAADRMSSIKRSEENSLVLSLYGGLLKGKARKLLHTEHNGEESK